MELSSNDGAALRRIYLPVIIILMLMLSLCGCGAEHEPAVFAANTEAVDTSEESEYSASEELLASEMSETAESDETTATTPDTSDTKAKTVTVNITEPVTTVGSETEPVTTPVTTSVPETTAATNPSVSETTVPSAVTVPESTSASTTVTLGTSGIETTAPAVTQAPVTTVQTAPAPSTVYSSDFFASDLFIGDSISTGYSLYGFLPEKNVYAKVGLNPSTVLTRNVATCYGEIGVTDMLAYTVPDRVYIMLGSNGIQWLSVANMLDSTDKLTELIKESCPDTEVVIISVPPVTPEYDRTVDDVNVMEKIDEYNDSLSAYCRAKGMLYIDIASVLKSENGYFNYTYAESDGMHFKSSAYKTILSKIQTDVTDFLDNKEKMAKLKEEKAAQTEPAVTEESEAKTTGETKAAETTPTETKKTGTKTAATNVTAETSAKVTEATSASTYITIETKKKSK